MIIQPTKGLDSPKAALLREEHRIRERQRQSHPNLNPPTLGGPSTTHSHSSPIPGFAQLPPPRLPSSRELTLRRLLWGSLAVTVASFALSMVFLGTMSWWAAVGGIGFTAIFDITLLVLHSKDLRKLAQQAEEVDAVPSYTASEVPLKSPERRMPRPARWPAIGAAFFAIVVWAGTVGILMYMLAYYNAFVFQAARGRILGPVWELVMAVTQVEILWAYVIVALKERKAIIKAESGIVNPVVQ